MNRHVLDQLPLWVEGDLDPSGQAAIEAHLGQCPGCREAAEQLRTSQSWLREALNSPFDASDQDRLRRQVMDQIRAEAAPRPIRRLALRPALLAACAAALLIATFTWRREQPVLPSSALVTKPPTPLPPRPEPHPPAQASLARSARLAPEAAREAPSPPHEEPARIEIQTADPTVRIIWLAQAKPLPEPTASLPEAP